MPLSAVALKLLTRGKAWWIRTMLTSLCVSQLKGKKRGWQ